MLRTVKSSRGSDEIFSLRLQMKLNPPPHPREAGFHREAISPTEGGFLPQTADLVEKSQVLRLGFFLVGDGGFGPPKSVTTDLQSAPFGRSGNPPYGAGERSRTINRLITNQVLCH